MSVIIWEQQNASRTTRWRKKRRRKRNKEKQNRTTWTKRRFRIRWFGRLFHIVGICQRMRVATNSACRHDTHWEGSDGHHQHVWTVIWLHQLPSCYQQVWDDEEEEKKTEKEKIKSHPNNMRKIPDFSTNGNVKVYYWYLSYTWTGRRMYWLFRPRMFACICLDTYLRKGTGTESIAVIDKISLEQFSSQLVISICQHE